MLHTSAQFVRGENRTLGRFLLSFMAIGFLALAGAGAAAWWETNANREHGWWVEHTHEVRSAIADAGLLLEQGETVRRGYLIGGQPQYLRTYGGYADRLAPAIDRVARLTRDNPRQQADVARLRAMVAAIVAQRDRTIATVTAGRRAEAQASFATEVGTRRMTTARALMARMDGEEASLLAQRDAAVQTSQRIFNWLLAAAGVLMGLVALISLVTVLRFTRDLTASRDTLRRLNDTLEEQVAERTADLSRANEEIQRFAYIVSHDLRSPLVNVMGFTAELSAATGALGELVGRVEVEAPALLSEDAKAAAREDLPEAIGFIRSSTQKMDRLINAILKLSREGRRVIAPEPVDAAAIADATVAAIRHIVDERGVVIEVARPMPALVTDRLAIEQILSNLIENATKYLQPGRPGRVTVSAREARGRVVIAVADNGRGIDPRDHQRIFDLFRRSGPQDQAGEGIGLAHVRALAYRLGGTIDVESVLGEGSTFRLNLPPIYQALQELPQERSA
jgi:signal transduction histidine kinase